jgi:membrane protein DedA with SNARE-associated domain
VTAIAHSLAGAMPLLQHYGYAVMGTAVMLEGTGIPLPGATLMGAAALMAGQGKLNLVAVWLIAWLAAAAGDNLGYWIGRRGGHCLLLRAGVNTGRLMRFEAFFRRFGVWLILFGRFFDGTRQLDGLVVGSARMPWPVFFIADLAGSAGWVSVWVMGLYTLEQHTVLLHRLLDRLNPWVLTAVFIALGITVYLLFRRSASGETALHETETAYTSPYPEKTEERKRR